MTGKEHDRLNNLSRVIIYAGLFYFVVYSFYLIGA
jgi:hypothetical protein